MIFTVTLNPALDKTVVIRNFKPGTVCRTESARLDAGGKGINISKVVQSLGGHSLAMGIAGGATGEYLCRELQKMEIPNDFVFSPAETRVNLKIVDPELGTNTDINDPGEPASQALLQQVFEKIEAAAQPGDLVAFAGKTPPETDEHLLAQWIEQLRLRGILTALDTVGAPMRWGVKALPTVIKPNQEELEELLGRKLTSFSEITAAVQDLVRSGIQYVVVSQGADGALFFCGDRVLRAHGVNVPVRSTVGAGDSMLASVLLDLQRGSDLETIATHAVAVGAAAVMYPGTQAPSREDVEALMDQVKLEVLA